MHELELVDGDRDRQADTLRLVGGMALVIVGAGLILSNRAVRKYISQVGVGDIVQAAFPDISRYMKMRAM